MLDVGEIAAASPRLAALVIGTNDLVQYLLAADRGNDALDQRQARSAADPRVRFVRQLADALRQGGYLFLGTSENISSFGDLFTPIEKKHRIFRRRLDTSSGTSGDSTNPTATRA